MNAIRRFGIVALVLVGLLIPGLAMPAAAQESTLCDLANGVTAGTMIDGYTVVYGSGGAGDQIVLGYGGEYLSGGSGNDVLCAWGSGNTLDGGSGNDLLLAMDSPGNAFAGGSGNDIMIGYEGDLFDGGSGRNTVIAHPDSRLHIDIVMGPSNGEACPVSVTMTNVPTDQGPITVYVKWNVQENWEIGPIYEGLSISQYVLSGYSVVSVSATAGGESTLPILPTYPASACD